MTGIPPFTDETPEKVFDNILNMRMEWPEDEGECYDIFDIFDFFLIIIFVKSLKKILIFKYFFLIFVLFQVRCYQTRLWKLSTPCLNLIKFSELVLKKCNLYRFFKISKIGIIWLKLKHLLSHNLTTKLIRGTLMPEMQLNIGRYHKLKIKNRSGNYIHIYSFLHTHLNVPYEYI